MEQENLEDYDVVKPAASERIPARIIYVKRASGQEIFGEHAKQPDENFVLVGFESTGKKIVHGSEPFRELWTKKAKLRAFEAHYGTVPKVDAEIELRFDQESGRYKIVL